MKLLLDVGNTRIKWAVLESGALGAADQIEHGGDPKASIPKMLDRCDVKPEQVRVSNVAGADFEEALTDAVAERWGLAVEFARSQSVAGPVRNGYRDYRQLGVDRWLALLAAVHHYRKAACVVDAGTAVTIDQVDDQGQHIGGVIIPGIALMRGALTGHTADLERLAGSDVQPSQFETKLIGNSTDEAMRAGAVSAIRGLIEESMKSVLERCDAAVLVVTGGDAGRIIPHLRMATEHRPMLVLEGLALYVAK